MMTPIVLQLDDDNCNGQIDAEDIPELIFTSFPEGKWTPNGEGTTRALAIVKGQFVEKWVFSQSIVGGAALAGGNIDGQPGNEIVACGNDGHVYAIRGQDGTQAWKSTEKVSCFLPVIADLDQDGIPEVIVEGGILNGKTGGLLFAYQKPPRGSLTVADLDGDGKLDVLSAFEAYRGDGSLLLDTGIQIASGTVSLAYPSVVDLDKDGIPEVIAQLFDSNLVAIWRYDNKQTAKFTMVRAPFQVLLTPGTPWSWTYGLGPVTAGDFNGDGTPDLGFVAFRGYVALDGKKLINPAIPSTLNALALWSKFTDEDNGSTGSAVFDFDGDGKVEVVYADSSRLHIYDGATGNVLFETCNTNGTLLDYPVVADVDNDGNADLVVVSNSYSHNDGTNPQVPSYTCKEGGSTVLNSGVRVFSSASGSWVRTRRVWNQHSYHVTNVNEDGSIPKVELPNWKQPGLNNFRQNKQPGSEFAAPDAIVSLGPSRCTPEPFTLTAVVRNIGQSVLPPGGTVSFFEGDPGSGKLLGTTQTTLLLYPAQSEIVSLTLPGGEVTFGEGQGQVSVTVSGPWNECNTDNNQSLPGYAACGKL
ncbi:MAG: VCBS repeat-containing protein [Myxococcales bacterium]|nr:VCBS repeat-containing protein [Polyangiaceae bacterium]MDW8251844.1 VCBS repeat-containing protein [Myxococcales bacterium]